VQRLLIEETLPIEKELYLGIVLDRATGKSVFMASAAGGMEIEEVAAHTPEAILKEFIEPGLGLHAVSGAQAGVRHRHSRPAVNGAVQAMMALSKACLEMDASLAEINPFILTKDNKVYALDAKINFDDNALFRHKDICSNCAI
jgi:succinyl-CoA synthetase beta subunit